MAEAILYGITENMIAKVTSSTFQEIKLVYDLRDDLKKFEDCLSTVKAVILDADEEKRSKNHAVENWVRRLQDIEYDADDLLDDLAIHDLRKKVFKGQLTKQVGNFFSSSNEIWFRHKVAYRIKYLTEKLNIIKRDISLLILVRKDIIQNGYCDPNMISQRETDSRERKSGIIGRDDDKKNIIDSLLCIEGQENVSVVAIVGLGGLGKTALAQMVYNDKRVDEHFDTKMWVCVSEDFEVKLLIKKILSVGDNLNLEQLQIELGKRLGGKRYLLVLDDVWIEDWQKWDNLRNYLLDGAPGSKILVTTRSKKVASIIGVESPYELQGLKENKAWELFENLVFKDRNSVVTPKLIEMGKEIVKKCKGVPLAIRTIGSLMWSKNGENEWLYVLENDMWRLCESRGDIIPVLKLSFDQLPIHLRQCFVFCAMFPKDFDFDKERLIYSWMAQGYIVASSTDDCLEEIGEQYFNELLFRSFFQFFFESEHRRQYYKMHDLIHDLAQSISKGSCILIEDDDKNKISERVQHVYCTHRVRSIKDYLVEDMGMRTLLLEGHDRSARDLRTITLKCNRLRYLCYRIYGEIPSSIGKLKHLRYLDISFNFVVKTLPNSLANLHNLQTLVLIGCRNLQEFPRDVPNLISLRHLITVGCNSLRSNGLGKLTGLQGLPYLTVDKKGSHSLNELEHLNKLRGRLVIDNLENVRMAESDIIKANLSKKERLRFLKLNWGAELWVMREVIIESTIEESELLLEKLQPHPKLQKLQVTHYNGVRFSSWLPRITNLVDLVLEKCPNLKQIQGFEQLPYRKSIHLIELNALEYISNEESLRTTCYPSLQEIELKDCGNLREWWKRKMNIQFPCLSRVNVSNCQNLASLPEGVLGKTGLQELKIKNCPKLSQRLEMEKSVYGL